MSKPTRETRETIKAELQMGERERIVVELRSVIHEIEEFEAQFQALEREAGLPGFYRSKPITERMAHLGMSQEAIDDVGQLLDAMEKVMLGRGDEMSDITKRMLAERAEAEWSAVDQLATIVENHQK
jgi:hypothetical protein